MLRHATPNKEKNGQSRRNRSNGLKGALKRNVRQVTFSATETDSGSDSSVNQLIFKTVGGKDLFPSVSLILYRRRINFVVDTAAGLTIVNYRVYQQLGCPALTTVNRRVFGYDSVCPITLIGKFKCEVRVAKSSRSCSVMIHVVRSTTEPCILGYEAATKLGYFKMAAFVENSTVFKIGNPSLSIGKYKDVQVKLHIDPSVKPIAQPHRRIPYHLHGAVEAVTRLLLHACWRMTPLKKRWAQRHGSHPSI